MLVFQNETIILLSLSWLKSPTTRSPTMREGWPFSHASTTSCQFI